MVAVDKKKAAAKKLPAVPESKLKVQQKRICARASLINRKLKKQAKISLRKRENFLRAEKYAHEYAKAERREVTLRRFAKKRGLYYVAGEPKLAFVMRIRGWVFRMIFLVEIS